MPSAIMTTRRNIKSPVNKHVLIINGNMVQGKRKVVSFKTKKHKFVKTDDWIMMENTHESIWDKEL